MRSHRFVGVGGIVLLAVCVVPLVGCSKGGGGESPVGSAAPVDIRGPILRALQPVYAGQGVPAAAAYGTQIPRPTVLLGPGGVKDYWSDALPGDWWPDSLSEAEVVVCVGPQNEVAVQSCRYNIGPNIVRHRFNKAVVLREARTARIIAKVTLFGSVPAACPRTAPYSQTREDGSSVAYEQAQAWFAPYVTGARRSVANSQPVEEPRAGNGQRSTLAGEGLKALIGSTEGVAVDSE